MLKEGERFTTSPVVTCGVKILQPSPPSLSNVGGTYSDKGIAPSTRVILVFSTVSALSRLFENPP